MNAAVIRCPVCGTENSDMATRCLSCGAIVQDRVPGLDLFGTVAALVTEPGKTFHRIARSEQKNYVYTLFAAAGPTLLALAFAAARLGESGFHFGLTVLLLFTAGPVAGIAVCITAAAIVQLTAGAACGKRLHFREAAPLTAYSFFPIGAVSLFILPLALAVFGSDLFTLDPGPYYYNPTLFGIFGTVASLCGVWSLVLLMRALRVVGVKAGRGASIVLLLLLFVGGIIAGGGFLLPRILFGPA